MTLNYTGRIQRAMDQHGDHRPAPALCGQSHPEGKETGTTAPPTIDQDVLDGEKGRGGRRTKLGFDDRAPGKFLGGRNHFKRDELQGEILWWAGGHPVP